MIPNRTAAPLGMLTVQVNLLATIAADRAFPAAVAELGRYSLGGITRHAHT